MSEQTERVNGKINGIPPLTRFTDIQRTKLEWIWPGRIPTGKISVIAGEPGLGKSLVTIAIASTITNEAKWPDCGEYAPFGSVVLLSAEDDDSDTVKPRLMAAQADESKVLSLASVFDVDGSIRHFSLDCDVPRLAETLDAVPDCRLLVIDPITAFMGNIDSHNQADVRKVLHQLSELAQKRQMAVLYVSHLNKGKGTPMSRVAGSGAYVAAARSAMLVGRDPADPSRSVVVSLKQNLAIKPKGVAYEIRETGAGMPVIHWVPGEVDIAPEELLSVDSGGSRHRDEVIDWLREKLKDGPKQALEMQQLANFAGYSISTLNRAKEELGVKSRRDGKSWVWALRDQGSHQDGHPQT